jgi:sec-independent protein translocase protein TatC
MSDGGQKLTLLGHLQELRRRIIRSVIAIAIAAIISFVFWKWILYLLISRAPGIHLIFVEVTEMVGVTMKVSIASALVLSMPYLVFQGIMFVSPALTRKEKKYLYIVLPWIVLMFVIGVVFCYKVLDRKSVV